MNFFVINGPNLNLLGLREVAIYGTMSYDALCSQIREYAESAGDSVCFYQSNHEGDLIDAIQSAQGRYDGMIINPGAYSHYSYAIYDALRAVTVPAVEVHISDIHQRESFRRVSVTAPACIAQIAGHGFAGYGEAMARLKEYLA